MNMYNTILLWKTFMASVDYNDSMEIIEGIMEWIAMRWSKSMIKLELRKWFPGTKAIVFDFCISAAKKEIRKRYNIDPNEYKGKQIAFYECVIRGKNKMHDKLTAAERLDKLFGLENLSHEDADTAAQKIRTALMQLENQIEGVPQDVRDKTERDRKAHAEQQIPKADQSADVKTEDSQEAASMDDIPEEIKAQLGLITPEELEGFRKHV